MRPTLTTQAVFEALAEVIPSITWDADRMAAGTTPELFATADALRRVAEGIPFRDAYREAADGVDGLGAPSAADALGGYVTPGTPGRVRADELRAALRSRNG